MKDPVKSGRFTALPPERAADRLHPHEPPPDLVDKGEHLPLDLRSADQPPSPDHYLTPTPGIGVAHSLALGLGLGVGRGESQILINYPQRWCGAPKSAYFKQQSGAWAHAD
eukprot:gene12661-biopygen3905